MSGPPRRYALPAEDAHLPPYESRAPSSTFGTRLKARLKYNRLTKLYLQVRNPRVISASQVFELKLSKFHYHALFAAALIGLCSF